MKWESLEPIRGEYELGARRGVHRLRRGQRPEGARPRARLEQPIADWLTRASPTARSATKSFACLLRNHITNVVTHFKGKIWQWDVVNEAASDPWDSPPAIHLKGFWAQHLGGLHRRRLPLGPRRGPQGTAVLQRLQHRGVRSGGASDKTQFVYSMAKQLRASGVPIDGVGSQGHLGTQYGNYDAFRCPTCSSASPTSAWQRL